MPEAAGALTPERVWSAAHLRMVRLDGALAEPVYFVDDNAVNFGGPSGAQVRRSDLFAVADAMSWRAYLDPPPVWLHLNAVRMSGGGTLVTIRRSEAAVPVGRQAAPAINVSVEPIVVGVEERGS